MSDDVYAIEWLGDFRTRWFAAGMNIVGFMWLINAQKHLESKLEREMRGGGTS
jgi:hypothetical protein